MVLDLAFSLPPAEFDTQFCTFDCEGMLAAEVRERRMALWFRQRHGRIDFGYIAWLARLLRQERIDILHAHNATAFFYASGATALVRAPRFLYPEHDRAFPTPLRQRGLHVLLSRRAHAVVTVSEALRDSLVAYECFPAERVGVIKNGVASRVPQRT